MNAVLGLKHYSTERLLDLWEMTTTNSDHNIPAVRGWLMDEIERRFPEAFEKWLDGDAEDSELRKYIENKEVRIMTYEEFTTLAKREISTTEYHEVVEPVYTYHPAIPNKETAAKLYDLCGLQVFRDMRPTADQIAALEAEERKINSQINELRFRLKEIKDEIRKMGTATPIDPRAKRSEQSGRKEL